MVVRIDNHNDPYEMLETDYYEREDYQYGTQDEAKDVPLITCVQTYCNFLFLYILGHIRDFLEYYGLAKHSRKEPKLPGFGILFSNFESFYIRNLYMRIRDCFEHVVSGCPGVLVDVFERFSTDGNLSFQYTGKKLKNLINLGSYNYLGFALPANESPTFTAVSDTIYNDGVGTCSAYNELGFYPQHLELCQKMSNFVGKEATTVFTMGFGTNAFNILCLACKGDLIISDEKNHTSLVVGARLSGATIKVFKNNDMEDLEKVIRKSVVYGHPRTHRPYSKILVIAEGIYSMDGSILKLPRLIELKRKYKAYIFVDEAHSIGALGVHGRGICDYWNIDPSNVDILMGTFTKSFGAVGGYIAGSKQLINYIRTNSPFAYNSSMPPAVATQISRVIDIIQSPEGIRKLKDLRRNQSYFRRRLIEMGFLVHGHRDSPVIPVVFSCLSKLSMISRYAMKKGLALVVVGSPATPLMGARLRFCMSSGHTRDMLDKALDVMDEIGDYFMFKIGY